MNRKMINRQDDGLRRKKYHFGETKVLAKRNENVAIRGGLADEKRSSTPLVVLEFQSPIFSSTEFPPPKPSNNHGNLSVRYR